MINILRDRRSIRQFTDKKLHEQEIATLKEALLRSPTSRNLRPWYFVFVDNPDLLEKLSQSKAAGSGLVKDAALAVVICADENVSDVWIEDCSIAAILLQLTAQSLGLGSCWVQLRCRKTADGQCSQEYTRQALNIPEGIRTECIIAIGYPAEEKQPLEMETFPKDRFHENGW